MIVARIVKPASKLATARGLDGELFFIQFRGSFRIRRSG
ncbi:hypothetical protein RintRC_6522 [Richelia intracellularis]|nr:hypothetical protein RintRC_6522 [Richelia intracellularis]